MFAVSTAARPLLSQTIRHIERSIGPSPMVFHDVMPDGMPLDLFVIPPRQSPPTEAHPYGRNFFTLVTAGMSALPIHAPVGSSTDLPRHAELMISLPPNWPGLRGDGTFSPDLMHNPSLSWPIMWLKTIACLSHQMGTFVGPGQIIPNDIPAQPFAPNTSFTDMLVLPSLLHPRSAMLVPHDDLSIAFYALWPIYEAEVHFHREHGCAALRGALKNAGVTDLLNPRRRAVAAGDRQSAV